MSLFGNVEKSFFWHKERQEKSGSNRVPEIMDL